MTGPEDVAIGVMGRWKAVARPSCPGGLWYGRVEENAPAPYARLGVRTAERQRLSDKRHIITFEVRIEIWGDTGPAGDVSRARRAAEAVMDGLTVSGALKVVDVRPAEVDLTLGDGYRAANDVCLASLGWQVKVETR